MKIIIPEIPPSLNKYAGRANTWDYRAEKQRWLLKAMLQGRGGIR